MSHARENKIRRLLGLGPQQRFSPFGGEDGQWRSPSPQQLQEDQRNWHQEGRRAQLAEKLAFAPQRIKHAWQRYVQYPWEQRKVQRRFAQARALHFTSHYVVDANATAVEGYFDLGDELLLGLTVYSATAMENYAKQNVELFGQLVTSDHTLIFGSGNWVVAPVDELTEADVRNAILGWYKDRFEWSRGHWSQLGDGDRLPQLTIDLTWADDNGGLGPNVAALRP